MGPEEEETYKLLAQGEGFRIGLVVEPGTAGPPSITIEFLLRLFRTRETLGPQEMERASELVGRLTSRGYRVFFQEDGWVSCEKQAGEADAEVEARLLGDIVGG